MRSVRGARYPGDRVGVTGAPRAADAPGAGPSPRDWWLAYEPIHAVVYFDPECRARMLDLGLRGFWMGYFAGRAAPFGPVGPELVEATFFNFHPAMVRRAIPDAWSFADPVRIWAERQAAAAAVLRRVLPGVAEEAGRVRETLSLAAEGGAGGGQTPLRCHKGDARAGRSGRGALARVYRPP